jgi:hypothetical protein
MAPKKWRTLRAAYLESRKHSRVGEKAEDAPAREATGVPRRATSGLHPEADFREVLFVRLRRETIDVDNGFSKSLRRFLRQVVPDSALDEPVFVLVRELLRIGAGLGISSHTTSEKRCPSDDTETTRALRAT